MLADLLLVAAGLAIGATVTAHTLVRRRPHIPADVVELIRLDGPRPTRALGLCSLVRAAGVDDHRVVAVAAAAAWQERRRLGAQRAAEADRPHVAPAAPPALRIVPSDEGRGYHGGAA